MRPQTLESKDPSDLAHADALACFVFERVGQRSVSPDVAKARRLIGALGPVAEIGEPFVISVDLAWDARKLALCIDPSVSDVGALRALGWQVIEAVSTRLGWADQTVDAPADYQDFASAMSDDGYLELSQHVPQPPSFDPAAHVLIFVELPDDAGTELRPGVEGIVRTDDHVRVLAYRTQNPEGAMTDNVTRSWVLIRAPKAVLEGDPQLSLELAEGVR